MAPELTRYEKWCHSLGNIIKIKVSQKDAQKVEKDISIAHLNIESWQAISLSLITLLGIFFLNILISFAIVLISGKGISGFPFLFFILMLMLGVFLFYFVQGYPQRLANKWRLKGIFSNGSCNFVCSCLYETYPNLEKAIALRQNIFNLLCIGL
jgi:hypothetical protein